MRSGDYYLFEDLDEKVELDLIHARPSAGIEDTLSDLKLADRKTLEQVIEIFSNVLTLQKRWTKIKICREWIVFIHPPS